MMRIPIFQVDAFSSKKFGGNPAAVMPMENFLPDDVLQAIAAENNLAETAFLLADGDDYRIRWFTPLVEVPLCGHATLASAAVVMEKLEPERRRVVFHSASGPLTVTRTETSYVMDFPARPSKLISTPDEIVDALGTTPLAVFENTFNYMVLLEDANTVANIELMRQLAISHQGLCVSLQNAESIANDLLSNNTLKPILYDQITTDSGINLWWILGLIAIWLMAEWFIRKWSGGY